MTTYQSTSLHVEDADEKSLAFTVADNPGEDDYALKAWSTFILPDNQVVNVEVKFDPQDVRDLQAFLRDRFDNGVSSLTAYPHQSGDVTVLGPEIFIGAADDGTPVISFKGRNFVPQASEEDNAGAGDTVASYFQDGWMASLRELLEMSKVRGYEEAVAWAKNQLGAYVGPAALKPPAVETIGEVVGKARQCPHISNSVQCSKVDWHVNSPETAEHTFFTDVPTNAEAPQRIVAVDGSVVATATVADGVVTVESVVDLEPSEAEKGRRRRLKVEMEFDDALEAHLAAPTDETWDRLSEAFKAVHKREPDNSRVRVPLVQRIGMNSDAAPTVTEAQRMTVPDSVPVVGFAPEPAVSGQMQQPWAEDPAFASASQAGQNYLAQSQHPINQQFHEAVQALPGEHFEDSVIMTPEQAAAAAFPCPQHSADNRQCVRPFGHELQTATNPEPKPHVYATAPSQLGVTGAEAVQSIEQALPSIQAAGLPIPTAPLSFQVPPTPGPAPVHIPADANQQPPAPAAPFWQQPQGGQ